jgi:DNA-binding MarR family transcriptional regulator
VAGKENEGEEMSSRKRYKVKYDQHHILCDKGNFFLIPIDIFDYDLKPKDLAVYMVLSRYSDSNGECYPSRDTIAENINVSVDTVDSALKQLKSAGVVEVTPQFADGAQITNRYRLIRSL